VRNTLKINENSLRQAVKDILRYDVIELDIEDLREEQSSDENQKTVEEVSEARKYVSTLRARVQEPKVQLREDSVIRERGFNEVQSIKQINP
jgi:hypothetical protein